MQQQDGIREGVSLSRPSFCLRSEERERDRVSSFVEIEVPKGGKEVVFVGFDFSVHELITARVVCFCCPFFPTV